MMKRRYIIEILIIVILSSCNVTVLEPECESPCTVVIDCGEPYTRAVVDEDLMWDLNLYITGEGGLLEEHRYIRYPEPLRSSAAIKTNLLIGKRYSLYAFANAGYDMGNMDEGRLQEFKWHLDRPDGFEHGFPMAGRQENLTAPWNGKLTLLMERLVSKVSVRLDRSQLDSDITLDITSLKVGNCPKTISPFKESAVKEHGELFPSGYFNPHGGDEGAVYLLENVQNGKDAGLCSFVEINIDYSSPHWYTEGGKGLIYRFYIRENGNFQIRRNCHYRIVITPQKDGLICEDSWRVDKSGLRVWDGQPYIRILPEGTMVDDVFYEHYYEMGKNETRHFSLALSPSSMKVWLREDMVEDERTDGRAVYELDADGKGFTVHSGSINCLSMMEIHAGPPLNSYESLALYVK